MEYTFTVPGKPAPMVRATAKEWKIKNRPGIVEYLRYKENVGWAAKEVIKEPLNGPVILQVDIYLKDRMKRRWDGANVFKAVEDALNGIAYHDDKQVTSGHFYIYTAGKAGADLFQESSGERVEVFVCECV